MSTSYKPLKDISFDKVFDGRLPPYGVREEIRADTSDSTRFLAGRDGVLAVFPDQSGASSTFVRPSFGNMPWSIFDALAAEFDTELVCEYDHRYWGFETAEEWEAFQDKIAKADDDDFYNDIMRLVRGEPNGLTPGTIGFEKAKIAKALIEGDSSFAEPEAREALFEALNAVYEKTSAAGAVVLTTRDRALAELLMARTDDLPQA